MNLIVLTQQDMIEDALQAAEATLPLSGLRAPTGDVAGQFERLWEYVRSGLVKAYMATKEAAKSILEDVQNRIDLAMENAAEQADELRRLLLARLSEYVRQLEDRILKLIRAKLVISEGQMQLTSVQVTHKVLLSGSVQASLAQVFQLTTSGELSVAASYSMV